MDKNIKRMFETFKKLDPTFQINEDSFARNFNDTTISQEKQPDVKQAEKAMDNSPLINKFNSKIDKPNEFQPIFKDWFTSLGITPETEGVTIARIMTDVKRTLEQLGYN